MPHGKKAHARGGVVAFVCEEVIASSEEGKVAKVLEWMGDIGASRHVCNNKAYMVDVCTSDPANEGCEENTQG